MKNLKKIAMVLATGFMFLGTGFTTLANEQRIFIAEGDWQVPRLQGVTKQTYLDWMNRDRFTSVVYNGNTYNPTNFFNSHANNSNNRFVIDWDNIGGWNDPVLRVVRYRPRVETNQNPVEIVTAVPQIPVTQPSVQPIQQTPVTITPALQTPATPTPVVVPSSVPIVPENNYIYTDFIANVSHLSIDINLPIEQTLSQWRNDFELTELEYYVMFYVNEYRRIYGTRNTYDMSMSDELSMLARYRTNFLISNGFVRANHNSGDVHRWGQWDSFDLLRAYSPYRGQGMNFISRRINPNETPRELARRMVFDGWSNSAGGHRRNMLASDRIAMGAGASFSIDGSQVYLYLFMGR